MNTITKEQWAKASFEVDEEDALSLAKLNDEGYVSVPFNDLDKKIIDGYYSEANVYLAMPRELWPESIMEKLIK